MRWAGEVVMSWRSSCTIPRTGRCKPLRARIKVDFPAPLAPQDGDQLPGVHAEVYVL